MRYKNPNSVLVAIYAQNTNRVLILQRRDDPTFWQSVTGALEENESPYQAALREVREETGIDIVVENLNLIDCCESIKFEIFPQFRYKYAPDVTHCIEHWFLLPLPREYEPVLSEHSAYRWVDAEQSAQLTKSWNNRVAIEKYLIQKPC